MNWQRIRTLSANEILAWAEIQPWAQAMAACQQDSQWHEEGDVWTHTKMVCSELQRLEGWNEFSAHDQLVLLFVALFHDAAKPATTQVDSMTGRVTSPKHAVKGELMARNILRGLNCDLQVREKICRLVRYHGRPAFLLEREQPIHEIVRMSWLVNNRLLYLFALADTRGRTTESMSRPEETLHYWKMQAEELGCFDSPYSFKDNHCRFIYFRQSTPDLHYTPFADFSCKVTLVCGLPGAGKDSWIERFGEDCPVISMDAIREETGCDPADNQGKVVQLAKEKCRELLRAGTSFVLNSTNTIQQTRAKWINLFADYKAEIQIVYLEPELERLLEQNRQRSRQVPESVILKLADKCEPPTPVEAHHVELLDEF